MSMSRALCSQKTLPFATNSCQYFYEKLWQYWWYPSHLLLSEMLPVFSVVATPLCRQLVQIVYERWNSCDESLHGGKLHQSWKVKIIRVSKKVKGCVNVAKDRVSFNLHWRICEAIIFEPNYEGVVIVIW